MNEKIKAKRVLVEEKSQLISSERIKNDVETLRRHILTSL